MRRWLVLVVVGLAACGGGSDGGDTDNGDSGGSDDAGQALDVSLLPDDFPDEMIPPDPDSGEYVELGGIQTANWASSMSFEDTIDHYNGVLGDGIVVGNDPGERLAQWTSHESGWIVSVFEGDETMIGVTRILDE